MTITKKELMKSREENVEKKRRKAKFKKSKNRGFEVK